jgi:hypothetical protein
VGAIWPIAFDAETCVWRIVGDAAALRASALPSSKRSREPSELIGPNDIAAATGMKAGNVRRLLGKLLKGQLIEKAGYGRTASGQYDRCKRHADNSYR